VLVSLLSTGLVAAEPVIPDPDVPTPSAPQYTIALVDASYNVPTTTSTDPFTGEVTVHEGYAVNQWNVTFKIKNEPFKDYIDNGHYQFHVLYYYHIQYKGPHEDTWHIIANVGNSPLVRSDGAETTYVIYSERTLNGLSFLGYSVPPDGRIDFRMQAIIGHWYSPAPFEEDFRGQSSGWVAKSLYVKTGAVEDMPQWTSTPTPTPIEPTPSATQTTLPTVYPTEPSALDQTDSSPSTQRDWTLSTDWRDAAIIGLASALVVAVLFAAATRRHR
jgi:hypothetical protein